jgi:putative resolvase
MRGMNGSRAKVRRLSADPGVTAAAAGHRDWLWRMNTELVEATLPAQGRGFCPAGYRTAGGVR